MTRMVDRQPVQGRGRTANTGTAGVACPARFAAAGEVVHDHLTGLNWTKDANIHQYPLAWDEAFALVRHLNRSPGKRPCR